MCVAATARRKRKQAANGYRHLSPMKRPRYKKRSVETSEKRLREVITKQKMISSRKGQKK